MRNANAPRQPESIKGAESGLSPGEGAPPVDKSRGKRPVEEEDIFGGAERNDKNEGFSTDHAKP